MSGLSDGQKLQRQRDKDRELFQAYKRIGNTPEEGLAWVLRFCDRALDGLSAGDWQNLIYEVLWFSIMGPPIPGAIPTPDIPSELDQMLHEPDSPLLSKDTIVELQQWAKAHLREFIDDWETSIPLHPESVLIIKRDRKTAKAEMTLKTQNLHQGFAFSFAQTLRVAGARLNQCPECQKYFSARSNQTYCSPRCQNRVSLAKFRENKKPKNRKTKSLRKRG
jgi:hypothetical protein